MSELQNVSCLGGGVQFWKDFIKIYEESPALWDPRSMAYKKPYLKREAYTKLRDKLREIDPNVQIDYVKRRINGLRSCYRRELRRIQDSKRKGDNLYRPTLFYFNEMNFLDDVLDIDIERDEREGKVSETHACVNYWQSFYFSLSSFSFFCRLKDADASRTQIIS